MKKNQTQHPPLSARPKLLGKLDYIKDDGGRMEEYNIKPLKKNLIGDCVTRAIAIALNQSYKQTLTELCKLSIEIGGMPNDPQTYEAYLFDRDWVKNKPPRYTYSTVGNIKGNKMRLKHWHHSLAIVHTTTHLTAIVDNTVRDTWDCRESCMNSFYTKETA